MEKVQNEEVSVKPRVEKMFVHKPIDTVLTRVSSSIKEEAKQLAKDLRVTMSWINDQALRKYIDEMRS